MADIDKVRPPAQTACRSPLDLAFGLLKQCASKTATRSGSIAWVARGLADNKGTLHAAASHGA